MDQLNQVTLRGIVGNARAQKIGDTEMVRFSVATDYAYRNRSGEAVIETTWHNVVAFKNDRMPDFAAIVKGAGILVNGRLRNNRFVDANAHFGNEVYSREELVAEIGSAMLCNRVGIEVEKAFRNSVAYIKGWLRALKDDPKMIVWAAGRAEKAAKFILNEV